MNFRILDEYFDVNSSEDTDTSNQGSYIPPNKSDAYSDVYSKQLSLLRTESDKIKSQLRDLYKLRTTKHKTVSESIAKCYSRMHLRRAQITKHYGETQLAIINWRILFESRYYQRSKL